MKLKILYICYEDISGVNGAIRHVTEIVKGLARRGHRIDLCVPWLGRRLTGLADAESVRLRYIPTIPAPVLRPMVYVLLSLLYLPWYFIRLWPDIVYIRDIKFSVWPVLLARLFRTPCLLEVNGLTDEAARVDGHAPWIVRLLDAARRWNLAHADRIITVTQGIRQEMLDQDKIEANKISIIPNGVDLERFRPMPAATAQERVGLSPTYTYVGFVGGLFPWHGLDRLVTAAPHVLIAEPSVRFVIVGTGQMEPILKEMIIRQGLDHAFIFTGRVPFADVPDYVNAFAVCVVLFKPVRKDPGDPIKLYEYLACGRPVVASNVRGYGDQVEAIGAGTAVDCADPQALARAIVRLVRDQKTAAAMGRKGFTKARACFGWEARVRETENVMRFVLPKDRREAQEKFSQ